jgi:hypothetical protein
LLDVLWPLCKQQPIERGSFCNQSPQSLSNNIEFTSLFEHICHRCAKNPTPNCGFGRFGIPLDGFTPMRVPEEPAANFMSPYVLSYAT